ncbi:PREDICTED: adenylate cyclase type 10-like [Dufourea novaeangliae]|uniref:adenylate cyclase type 10-like n=1 Tax=Dufourea novaeangliae TaxID=178035 RepID=UPI000767A9C2|nr:PREDICTED: adenylate cyclase type 10-like [Dufourea novaeangliae]
MEMKLEQHTKIFASMCPDEILDYYDNYATRMYYTTLMLGDVSGFTDLAEKYTKTGRGGPSKLTETLNSYIGAMVQEILSHNGDVLKFSGDAFIVMWKLNEGMMMRDLAIEAMQTACIIQKHFGTYETEVGVTLKVKLAIASGKTYFTSIGRPDSVSHYIITGKPVWDVKFAEGLCRGGDILVAPSSWQWVNPNEYVHETLEDGVHTLILACTSTWYQSRDDEAQRSDSDENERIDYYDSTGFASKTVMGSETEAVMMSLAGNLERERFKQIDYSLRPKVIKIAKARLKDALRSYMLRPVIRSVEMDEPLEYLTEMRQVVILFINVLTSTVGKRTLISLVNSAYKLVCKIVGGMHGCVNKTSLFDKDLMFLCVFGLRGDKHELESQIGLKCASKLRNTLAGLKYVKSVTVSVTTGMTYCGVVGHILRREYTVIGMSVNKAARLMVAYRDKVVCDRESFLQSHLEARHFILQEPRYLKGITNVGPIYEFQEKPKYNVTDLVWNKYPLLGRDAEIKKFQEIMKKLLEYSMGEKSNRGPRPKYNTLVIKGEPRIGKTKLLDECTQKVPVGIHCNYVSLRSNNSKVDSFAPYSLILMIFSMSLAFTVSSMRKEREDKLLRRLGKVRQSHFLCALNQPFNVRFPITHRYNMLSDMDKWKILRKFLLKLLKSCFTELWVIIIDDAEYTDHESLRLFDVLTKRDMVFFVLGIGRKLGTEFQLHPNLLDRGKIIELHGIDRWFHAGLACQTLNVNGLPAELEKLIQEKSFGNPGWIESYLVSLMQAGGIEIVIISKKEAIKKGYVMPPVNMLKRFASTAPITRIEDSFEERKDRWQMYRMSFKDSLISLLEESSGNPHKLEITADTDETLIAVCKISEKFSYDDVDTEITMDVMILKLFDSLTPLDQLLLKCASVIGETVNRHMLECLMNLSAKREIGLAVAKLFEIRVFGCAIGDFSSNTGPIVFIQNVRNPTTETDIFCNCVGLTVPTELEDLPRYASCGLMRFKMTMFRDTTYRLLTENQKMELHNQALKYLKQYTRRCAFCGEGQFAKLLGNVSKREDRLKKRAVIEGMFESVEFRSASAIKEIERNQKKWFSCLNLFRRVERRPTITFSDVDFSNCQCDLILMTVYTQMLDHCRGIGLNEMTMIAILEFAEICLMTSNIPQARKLLAESETILGKLFSATEDEVIVLPYLTSKIQTLQGQCYLESGSLFEAEQILEAALNNLGYKFPKMEIMIDLKSIAQLVQLRWKFSCINDWNLNTDYVATQSSITQCADYTEQLAECLAKMFDLFRIKGMKRHARLAAIWGLNTALETNRNLFVLSTSYTNMLITAHMYQDRAIVPFLEEKGLEICRQSKDAIESQELNMIAELYAGIFFSRWVNGQISKAIKIGFICCRMAAMVGSTFLKLLIMPRLAHLLMLSCRHSEAITQLRELEFESNYDLDKSGRTWYYALCADVQLDTGITLLSFKACEQYFLREGEAMISLHDPEAERRYFVSMWLWCVRTEQWEASIVWERRSVNNLPIMDEHIVAATITSLKRLEGLLILYVHKLNSRNIDAVTTLTEIKSIFREMKKMTKIVKLTIPTYILLKAYYYMIKFRKGTAMKLLKRLKKVCWKMENEMVYTWATHYETVWSNGVSSVQEDRWKDASTSKLHSQWSEINANESNMVIFTFPLPIYPN